MSKKIKRIICCVCASLVLIVALCLPFVFRPKIKTKNLLASADSSVPVYSYSGSSLYFRSYFFTGISMGNFASFLQTDFNISFNLSASNSFATFRTVQKTFSSSFSFGNLVSQKWSPSSSEWHRTDVLLGMGDWYYSIYCRVSESCDFNFVGCYITSYVNIPAGQFVDDFNGANTRVMYINYIRYFGLDLFGNIDTTNFIEIAIPFLTGGDPVNIYAYTTRTYYFTRVDTESATYSAGYNAGYDLGVSAGQTAGYNTGYSDGDSVGYNRGYNVGVNSTNTYSFTNLISAVLDAPINAFTSLFNFEILGVNLSSFLLALFTICVVLTVIKFIF